MSFSQQQQCQESMDYLNESVWKAIEELVEGFEKETILKFRVIVSHNIQWAPREYETFRESFLNEFATDWNAFTMKLDNILR